jgi:6,7-dimethyl-8-ribityllumazine synthase
VAEEGEPLADADRERLEGLRFAIVVAGFYPDLAARLEAGARAAFAEAGIQEGALDVHHVQGAFELPLAAALCARSGRYAGVACLGAVIRGETDHYDHVCREAAAGIREAGMETGVPCSFGVLTCDTMEQALARTGGGKRDQGRDAANAVIGMTLLSQTLTQDPAAATRP